MAELSDPTAKAAAELAARVAASLDEDQAYERYGELVTDPWGSGQWVKYTDPDGREHYLRIVVEPYRPD
jgi:hypothetical protein